MTKTVTPDQEKRAEEINKYVGILFTATTGRSYRCDDMAISGDSCVITTQTKTNSYVFEDGWFEKSLKEASPQITVAPFGKVLDSSGRISHHFDPDTQPIKITLPLDQETLEGIKKVALYRFALVFKQRLENEADSLDHSFNCGLGGQLQYFESSLKEIPMDDRSGVVSELFDKEMIDQLQAMSQKLADIAAKWGPKEITRDRVAGVKQKPSGDESKPT